MRFDFIRAESAEYPIRTLCRVMQVSTSAYYDWARRPGKVIEAQELMLRRRMRVLFKQAEATWVTGR